MIMARDNNLYHLDFCFVFFFNRQMLVLHIRLGLARIQMLLYWTTQEHVIIIRQLVSHCNLHIFMSSIDIALSQMK